MARVLLVEDEINVLKMTQMILTRAGHNVSGVSSGNAAMAEIDSAKTSGNHLDYDDQPDAGGLLWCCRGSD